MLDKVTTKTLEYIRRRNVEGASDVQIGKELGLSSGTIRRFRKRLGLPAVGKRGYPCHVYAAYLRKTDEYVCGGTAKEISERLGISVPTVYSTVTRSKKDKVGYRYYIVEVEDDE